MKIYTNYYNFVIWENNVLDANLNVPSTYQLVQLASTSLPDSLIKMRSLLAMGVSSLCMMVWLRMGKGSWSVVLVS